MAYTNNTPQANQQIATTQPLILDNFGFLATGLAVDHNFNAAGSGSDLYHNKASMPSNALSPALPVGTVGAYFVNGTDARYYDGTNNWFLNLWTVVEKGTVALGSTGSWVTVGSSIPQNQIGVIYLYQAAGGFNVCVSGQFLTTAAPGTKAYTFLNSPTGTTYVLGNASSPSGDKIEIEAARNDIQNKTFTFVIMYRPV